MRKQGVVDFYVAVVLIVILLIGPQAFHKVFVGLRVLVFELLKQSFSLLHVYLFYAHSNL